MASLADRVGVSTSTQGAGTIALGPALAAPAFVCAFRSFAAAGVVNGAVVSYFILDANGGYEFGRATYNSVGPTLSSRTVKGSSNGNAAIVLSGNAQVYVGPLAEDIVSVTDDQTALFTAAEKAQARKNVAAAVFDSQAYYGMQQNEGHLVSQAAGDSVSNSGSVAAGAGFNATDGNRLFLKGSFQLSWQRISDVPPGFKNANRITITTPQATLGTSDAIHRIHKIEGKDWARLMQGGGSAQAFSIAWAVRSSIANHTFNNFNSNSDESRNYIRKATLAANTWTVYSTTIPGCLDGVWDTSTGVGAFIVLALAAGSSYWGTADAWNSGSLIDATADCTNMAAVNGATFDDIGPFVFPGNQAPTTLEQLANLVRTYGQMLPICQRSYFDFTSTTGNDSLGLTGHCISTTQAIIPVRYPVPEMRATPAFSLSGTAGRFGLVNADGSSTVALSVAPTVFGAANNRATSLLCTVAAGLTAGAGTSLQSKTVAADSKLVFDARL